jgi:inorganic triphosphatase YgiF
VSLRVRQNEQGLVQTLKQQKSSARLQANFAVDVERLSITLAIGKSRLEAAVDQGSVKEGNVRLDHDPKAGDDRLEILVAVAP